MRILRNVGRTAALFAVLLAGCGGDDRGGTDTAGTGGAGGGSGGAGSKALIIDGSSTVYRISQAAQLAYKKLKPDYLVVVNNHGTGGGFSRYLQEDVDIVDASRPAKPEEESAAKAQGLEWTRFLVGYDGITLVVNPSNSFVKSLTVEQLKKIWAPESAVKTWKDVDPTWPDSKIVLYSPDGKSGTFEFFVEAVVGGKSQREGVQQNSDDNFLVKGVAGDKDGLGYFGYAYYAANKTKLKAVAVQNGPDAKPVLPDRETILKKEYAPLSRPLFIYVKNSSLRQPQVAEFVQYYLDNCADLAEKGGYVAPTADDKAENEKAFSGFRGK